MLDHSHPAALRSSSLILRRSPQSAAALLCLLSLVSIGGCARQIELTYTPSAETVALPQEQVDEIGALLTGFYGTPTDPVLMTLSDEPPAEDSEEPYRLESQLDPDHLKLGAVVYQERCAGCHGVTGDGQGPAAPYLDPKPRDYRRGIFKFTSTGRAKPRKSDLVRVVKYGARGTSMPSFRWLPEDELSAVVDYVIVLSQRGQTESKLVILAEDEELDFAAEDALAVHEGWLEAPSRLVQPATPQPPVTEEAIQSGRHEFLIKGCAKCHGSNAQGFTQEPLKDDWGNDIYAANLTSGMLHGGRRKIDVYRRIYSGINGTPMPAFGPEFSPAYTDNPEKIWHLTYYVLELAEGREFPKVTDEEASRMAIEDAHRNAPMPEPTNPEPSDPEPSDPEPSDPEPSDPEPSDPEPSDPEPSDPEPSDPEPSEPEPTEPSAPQPGPSDPKSSEDPRDAHARPPVPPKSAPAAEPASAEN